MNRLFLVALACAANICMQAHNSQPRTQQLPREVIQELKQKQQTSTTSQPAAESMPSKKMIALKFTGGVALTGAGILATRSVMRAIRNNLNAHRLPSAIAIAALTCGLATLYQAKQLFSDAYNDVAARKEAIAQLKASQQNA